MVIFGSGRTHQRQAAIQRAQKNLGNVNTKGLMDTLRHLEENGMISRHFNRKGRSFPKRF
ncbi:hypothetical protein BTA30_08995 [Bacillus swezeyi]|uniref:Uncharacterized protein n=1 Tax=Bacillus swezeyi TaxID=1925020 RepID=A0A1R1Q979_9BACI|nr:hypothetical protein BW143_20740 [Bacillus swezeyi]OMI31717.1 hypothetical protein BTA30_08995 [Bacillus swezeyi]